HHSHAPLLLAAALARPAEQAHTGLMRQDRLAATTAVGHLLPKLLRNNALVDFSLLDFPDQSVQAGVVTWNETGLLALDGLTTAAPAEARPLLVLLKPKDRVPDQSFRSLGFRVRIGLLEFGLYLLAVLLDER